MKKYQTSYRNLSLPELTSELQRKDHFYKQTYKILKIIYIVILFLVLLGITLVGIFTKGESFTMLFIVEQLLAVLGFGGILALLVRKEKELNSVDYSLSTKELFQNLVKRYSFISKSDIWMFIPFSFIIAKVKFNLLLCNPISFLTIYVVIIVIILLVSWIVWFVFNRSFRDRAKALLKEIEE